MADGPKPGLGVDAHGEPVIDPTRNVLDLVAAAIERQDDLRKAGEERIDTKIDGHVKLSCERYAIVQQEFGNIERRRIEHKNDTKIAVDSAFSAAKELMREQATASNTAIGKSEATVSGQIKAVEGTVDDLKDRVRTLETQQQTKTETRSDARSSIGTIVGILGTVFGFLMLAAVIIIAALRG